MFTLNDKNMFIASASFAPYTTEVYYKSRSKAVFDDRFGEFGQFYDGAVF